MNLNPTWSALEEIYDILGGYGYPAIDKTAEEMGLEPDFFTWLVAVWLFGAETFTVADFMRMFPYGQPRENEESFTAAAQKGYLISNGNSGYVRAQKGMEIAQKLWRAAGDSLASLKPISDKDEQRLMEYLGRLVNASLAAPEPPSHFYLSHKHENYSRYGTKSPLEDFIVRFGALSAFRDDMYITSWSAHGVQGHVWETLDKLTQNDALTFDDLFEKAKRRVPTRELLAENIMELARRGWADDASGKIQITSAGKQARAEVEAETERLFFAPWACLNESELEELSTLASQLRDRLRQ
ncbi:MAG: hypothetical protein HS100_21950 [Anaerolineales bacterium]|nr:hypothetical protein [Anaerolineales bacterium]